MKKLIEPTYNQAYIDTGEGHAVILLHGLFGNLAMWRSTIFGLQQNYRVIVPRLPLFDIPIHRANVGTLVQILHDFLDWRELTDVTLVGTDIGGQIALCYAYEHPERVRKIVLSGSSGLFEKFPPDENDFSKDFDSVHDHVLEAFHKKDLVTPNLVDRVYKTINTSSKELHITFLSQSSKKTDISRLLSRLKVPVLLVWGLQDKITPPEVALQFHDLLKFGSVKFINECGHLPMIEKPELYVGYIKSFLTEQRSADLPIGA